MEYQMHGDTPGEVDRGDKRLSGFGTPESRQEWDKSCPILDGFLSGSECGILMFNSLRHDVKRYTKYSRLSNKQRSLSYHV
jgi:hypothetical protein